MKPSSRAAHLLFALLAVLAPVRAAAQEVEAWVLPRGLLEVSGTGLFMDYDGRLGFGDPAFGSELVAPLRQAFERSTAGPLTGLRTGLDEFFAATEDPEADPLPDSLTPGVLGLQLTGDVRLAPITIRYGLFDRLTLSLTLPIERRGTSAVGPYLLGSTLGINPDPTGNAALLSTIGTGFGDLGGGLFLPVAGTPEAVELQSRLSAIDPVDTLTLPTAPATLAQLLGNEVVAAQLTEEELAALGVVSARRPYELGDIQLGARFLLLRGPAGWPFPDSVTGPSFRASVGARLRLPTGGGATRFLTEIPAGNGHLGAGVDVMNDVFLSSRWYVSAAASLDVLFPADVQRLAFSAARPFPADSAVRTVRREPGPRLAVTIAPRWRLTDEISFSGEYALLAQGRTEYTGGEEGLLPSPMEWRTGGSLHSVGIGARYSSLQAFARGRASVPFEVTLTLASAVTGAGAAPKAASVRVSGRIFINPRGFARLLPGGEPADTVVPPPPPAADTVPSQPRAEPVPPRVPLPAPDTAAVDTAAAVSTARVPPVPPQPTVSGPRAPSIAAGRQGTRYRGQPVEAGSGGIEADRGEMAVTPPPAADDGRDFLSLPAPDASRPVDIVEGRDPVRSRTHR